MYLDKDNEEFRNDIIRGLLNPVQKSIPSKYLYDTSGSHLFELITIQPEYYPTRIELKILQDYSSEIIGNITKEIILIELGSGSSKKTKYLFDGILKKQKKLYYFPIDISFEFLDTIVSNLENSNENVIVKGIPEDYITGIKNCNNILFQNGINFHDVSKLIVFFGSSIGNFELEDARDFLKLIRLNMDDKDHLLIGFDMVKDINIVEPAYNDKAGVTSEFNLNILNRINKELGGNFCKNEYIHYAFYNADRNRIEMHIKAKSDQEIRIFGKGEKFFIKRGETIHTENSYKYDKEKIFELASRSGFLTEKIFSDKDNWFNLVLLSPC